jgi:hypothetical protein
MKLTFQWPWKKVQLTQPQPLVSSEEDVVVQVSKPSVFPREPDPEILAFCATNPTENEFIARFPDSDLAKYLLECREVFPNATTEDVVIYINKKKGGSIVDLKRRYPNYDIKGLFLMGWLKSGITCLD